MRRIVLSLFFFCLLIVTGSARTVVTGRVTGVDGEPMIMANVVLRQPFDTTRVEVVKADRDGRFRLTIPSDGVWMLVFKGVHHADHIVALYVSKPQPIEVNVKLTSYTYLKDFSGIKAIGTFNNWYFITGVPLHKQSDGTYTAEIRTKAPSIAYRLMGVREGGDVEGTQSAIYSYNRNLGYESIIGAMDGTARIVFDPKKLVRSDNPAKVEFVRGGSLVARFNEIYAERLDIENAFRAAFRANMRSRGRNPSDIKFDFSKAASAIQKQLETEKDPILRSELHMNYLSIYVMGQRIDPPFYTSVLKEIPPTSMVWSLDPNSIFFTLNHSNLGDEQKDDYVRKVVAENPIIRVKSALLFDEFLASKSMEDKAKAAHYYDLLVEKFGDTPEAKLVSKTYTRPRTLADRESVPAFSVVSLDNSARLITDKSLRGKYGLIFFWAAEDPGSVEQVSYLQKAFAKYKDRKFEILTLSVDSAYSDVVKFREKHFKMPWLNGYLGKNRDNKVVKAFGAYQIPNAYLVNPNGIIVARGKELLGPELEETLKKYLGD